MKTIFDHREDRRLRALVYSVYYLRIPHEGQVMNRTRDAYRDLKLRFYDQLAAPGKLKKRLDLHAVNIYWRNAYF